MNELQIFDLIHLAERTQSSFAGSYQRAAMPQNGAQPKGKRAQRFMHLMGGVEHRADGAAVSCRNMVGVSANLVNVTKFFGVPRLPRKDHGSSAALLARKST